MLNMNTQKKQSIFIGVNYMLTLDHFDEDCIQLTLTTDGGQHEDCVQKFTVMASEGKSICPDVNVHFHGLGNNGHPYAILAFDAPRHINIKGEWQNFNRGPGPADRAKLSQMSDASLVYYASMNAKTPLEHELMNRFKRCMKK